MHTLLLCLLRHDARVWWYHARLRQEGQIAEARARERASVRSALRLLRLEHHHRTRFVAFAPAAPASTMCASGIHPGEWAALHLVHGWPCLEPVPGLVPEKEAPVPAQRPRLALYGQPRRAIRRPVPAQ